MEQKCAQPLLHGPMECSHFGDGPIHKFASTFLRGSQDIVQKSVLEDNKVISPNLNDGKSELSSESLVNVDIDVIVDSFRWERLMQFQTQIKKL